MHRPSFVPSQSATPQARPSPRVGNRSLESSFHSSLHGHILVNDDEAVHVAEPEVSLSSSCSDHGHDETEEDQEEAEEGDEEVESDDESQLHAKAAEASKRRWFPTLPTLTPLQRNILKCSIAYFIGSLFTFSPYLSGFISDLTSYGPSDGDRVPSPTGHMVATMYVNSHSAWARLTIVSVRCTTILRKQWVLCSRLICFASLAYSGLDLWPWSACHFSGSLR